MQNKCCKTCSAYVANATGREGQCRASSPTVLFLGMMEIPTLAAAIKRQQPIIQGYFAPVREDLWCREWIQAQENSTDD